MLNSDFKEASTTVLAVVGIVSNVYKQSCIRFSGIDIKN